MTSGDQAPGAAQVQAMPCIQATLVLLMDGRGQIGIAVTASGAPLRVVPFDENVLAAMAMAFAEAATPKPPLHPAGDPQWRNLAGMLAVDTFYRRLSGCSVPVLDTLSRLSLVRDLGLSDPLLLPDEDLERSSAELAAAAMGTDVPTQTDVQQDGEADS